MSDIKPLLPHVVSASTPFPSLPSIPPTYFVSVAVVVVKVHACRRASPLLSRSGSPVLGWGWDGGRAQDRRVVSIECAVLGVAHRGGLLLQ
jgi:hypothetical protein